MDNAGDKGLIGYTFLNCFYLYSVIVLLGEPKIDSLVFSQGVSSGSDSFRLLLLNIADRLPIFLLN